jgi:hypothetical protein
MAVPTAERAGFFKRQQRKAGQFCGEFLRAVEDHAGGTGAYQKQLEAGSFSLKTIRS